jgi:hypothetical protein
MKIALLLLVSLISARAADLRTGGLLTLEEFRALEATCPVEVRNTIKLPRAQRVDCSFTNRIPEDVEYHFYLKWVIETNDSPRECLGWSRWTGSTNPNETQVMYLSGGTAIGTITFGGECPKEHFDPSEHAVIRYVSSNLVSTLVWRGRTNLNYLESIPLTNITNHWHYEKKQVWTN